MTVSFFDLRGEVELYRDEVMAALARVVDSASFILGDEVSAFEAALTDYAKVPALGVSSGTDALLLALWAMGVGPGDEVVTTPFTFFATAGVIARLGAKPVFADIDPVTLNLSLSALQNAITDRTKAVVPVHLFGLPCDLGDFYNAKDRPMILEDAAQAIGATLGGRPVGTLGEAAALSFFPTKNLGGMGDGGAILSTRSDLMQKMHAMRVHGAERRYYHSCLGGNFRLDAMQAAVLKVKLKYVEQFNAMRKAHAERYQSLFDASGLTSSGLVQCPPLVDGAVVHQYVIQVKQRDALRAYLADNNIGTAVYYPTPLHLQPCFEHLGQGVGSCPVAEAAAQSVLALPISPMLKGVDQEKVVDSIACFFK